MDNLTHSLVGVLLSRAGLNKLARRAGWLALVSANLPDADIVAAIHGAAPYLEQHRGWTHAVAYAPLLAVAPLPFWYWANRKEAHLKQVLGAYVVALIAVLSHLLLDWMNIYGIRLLLPFDARWLHLDLLNIIDVWVWGILLIFGAAPLLSKLVYSEIGAKHSSGRGSAWTGLVLLSLYIGTRAIAHDRAVEVIRSRNYDNWKPRYVYAVPSLASLFHWTALVETEPEWRVIPLDLLREFDPDSGHKFNKPVAAMFRESVLHTQTARVFLSFSQAPLWRLTPVPEPEGATRVQIFDLRFGLPDEGAFTADFLVGAQGRVLSESLSFGKMGPGRP